MFQTLQELARELGIPDRSPFISFPQHGNPSSTSYVRSDIFYDHSDANSFMSNLVAIGWGYEMWTFVDQVEDGQWIVAVDWCPSSTGHETVFFHVRGQVPTVSLTNDHKHTIVNENGGTVQPWKWMRR